MVVRHLEIRKPTNGTGVVRQGIESTSQMVRRGNSSGIWSRYSASGECGCRDS